MAMKVGYCKHCGRNDVPICDDCGKQVPHGNTYGTWLPCSCTKRNEDELSRLVARNIEKEISDK